MSGEPVYEKTEQKASDSNDEFTNPPFGFMIAVIFGETYKSTLSYNDDSTARLDLIISTRMPYRRFTTGAKFYRNRVSVWGRDAEALAKVIKDRDETKKRNGTFLVVWCKRFGGEKLGENWSHTFSCFKYKIINDPKEFLDEIGQNQDSGLLNINSMLGVG